MDVPMCYCFKMILLFCFTDAKFWYNLYRKTYSWHATFLQFVNVWLIDWLIDWLIEVFHLTQNRSFWRHCFQPVFEDTKTNTTKVTVHRECKDTVTQNKQKAKARFGCLLQPLVWKQRRPYSYNWAHTVWIISHLNYEVIIYQWENLQNWYNMVFIDFERDLAITLQMKFSISRLSLAILLWSNISKTTTLLLTTLAWEVMQSPLSVHQFPL